MAITSTTPARAASVLVGYGLLVAGALVLLDAGGAFIFLTYVPCYLALALYAVLAARRAARTLADYRLLKVLLIIFPVLVATALLVLPRLETSDRKRLFVASKSLSTGMQIGEAREVMRPFQVFDRYASEGVLTFGHRPGTGNEDHVIVRFSPSSQVIESVEYSID